MVQRTATTRVRFAEELGMSVKTLMRKLNKLNFKLAPGLIMPDVQEKILQLLGFKAPPHDS